MIIEQKIANQLFANIKEDEAALLQKEREAGKGTQNPNFETINSIKNNIFLNYKTSFEEIIDHTGPTYSNVLARIKQKYDGEIKNLKNRLNSGRINKEIEQQKINEASAVDIYKRRIDEIGVKLRELKGVREKKLAKLEELRVFFGKFF